MPLTSTRHPGRIVRWRPISTALWLSNGTSKRRPGRAPTRSRRLRRQLVQQPEEPHAPWIWLRAVGAEKKIFPAMPDIPLDAPCGDGQVAPAITHPEPPHVHKPSHAL